MGALGTVRYQKCSYPKSIPTPERIPELNSSIKDLTDVLDLLTFSVWPVHKTDESNE